MNKVLINCPFCKKEMYINYEHNEFMCPFCGEDFVKKDFEKEDSAEENITEINTDNLSLNENRTLRIPNNLDCKLASGKIVYTDSKYTVMEN